jgi:hypothetical protein
MVLFTTSFEAVHTLHTLSDYGRRTGSLHHLVQLHQSLVCFGCSSSLKLQSPLWDRAPLASQQSPSHPRQRSRRAWLVYWLWMSSAYKILRSADPSSKFPVCGKEAGWYRSTIQVIRSLFGWIVVFSNASSVKCWIQGCDGRDGRWIGWEFHDG